MAAKQTTKKSKAMPGHRTPKEVSTAKFERLCEWVSDATGLDRDLLDRPAFADFVKQHMQQLATVDEAAYLALLRSEADELERVVEAVAVPETRLFRYPESFELLANHLRTAKDRLPNSRSLRMLSIACATGEEAYSAAIAAAYAGWPINRVTVDAVDSNSRSIGRAKRAAFPSRSMRTDLPAWSRAWLDLVDDQLRVAPPVANAVNFRCCDVLRTDSLVGNYDVIFCRNLFIYLSRSARDTLALRIARWLSRDGVLFVGHAEGHDSLREHFQRVKAPHAFAWRLPGSSNKIDDSAKERREETGELADGPPTQALTVKTRPLDVPVPGHVALPQQSAMLCEEPSNMNRIPDARGYADAGDLRSALEVANQQLLEEGPSIEVCSLLGTLYLAVGELSEAKDCLHKVIYLQPSHEDALIQLAMIYQEEGNHDRAARYRRRAARAHDDSDRH